MNGREIRPEDVLGPPRPGRKIVYTGDTRPCESVIQAAENADILIHDGSLAEAEKELAIEYMHSTVTEAAEVAAKANVRKLILTHISARYDDEDAKKLEEEARKIFPNTIVASDLMTIDV